ncbi:21803_t:CDS:2 [Dentiscutata erythropus]|uniref:21803_t:CDS:1 n=1 Tax=Dentiscutata erythropus TaxID=1348616 RepID=A0A9N8VTK2_9GLOM|nr:21803_t:CDS:2 [Dentiscutata erythropus]
MSLPVNQISIIDLDENNSYHDLCNDIFSGYQVRLDINANHPRAPTLASAFSLEIPHQPIFNLPSFPPWQPSCSLISLNHRFQTELLYMFPCVPYSHCLILMYPFQARWVSHDINIDYDLSRAFPHLSLTKHSAKEEYIAQQIDKIINNMQWDIAAIISNQLNTLMCSPPSISSLHTKNTSRPICSIQSINLSMGSCK